MQEELAYDAVKEIGGVKMFFKDKMLHREDGPAVEYPNGDFEWWFCGQLHRLDGPCIVRDGMTAYYVHNELHREDGPALVSSDGVEFWYLSNRIHSVVGPAVVSPEGDLEYWLHGEHMCREEWVKKSGRSAMRAARAIKIV